MTKQRLITLVITLLVAIGVAGFELIQNTTTSPPSLPTASKEAGQAIQVLQELPIKGRAPKTGYSREQFGEGWALIGMCDVRNHILRRDLTQIKTQSDRDCTVISGVLIDPYTNKTIPFQRGAETSDDVQIDHVVALSDAWQKGAQQLTQTERQAFANDPLNLLAVDGPTNTAKGDGDAATWLPPYKEYRCRYVARQIAVKKRYRLWVTWAEHDAMARVLQTCPEQQLPIQN